MNYNYQLLEILRHHTVLGVKEKIVLLKKLEDANTKQQVINEKEHCNIGVDFTEAYTLEYQFRMKKWQNRIIELYHKYGKGQDFYDFSVRVLMDKENERIKKSKKLKRFK